MAAVSSSSHSSPTSRSSSTAALASEDRDSSLEKLESHFDTLQLEFNQLANPMFAQKLILEFTRVGGLQGWDPKDDRIDALLNVDKVTVAQMPAAIGKCIGILSDFIQKTYSEMFSAGSIPEATAFIGRVRERLSQISLDQKSKEKKACIENIPLLETFLELPQVFQIDNDEIQGLFSIIVQDDRERLKKWLKKHQLDDKYKQIIPHPGRMIECANVLMLNESILRLLINNLRNNRLKGIAFDLRDKKLKKLFDVLIELRQSLASSTVFKTDVYISVVNLACYKKCVTVLDLDGDDLPELLKHLEELGEKKESWFEEKGAKDKEGYKKVLDFWEVVLTKRSDLQVQIGKLNAKISKPFSEDHETDVEESDQTSTSEKVLSKGTSDASEKELKLFYRLLELLQAKDVKECKRFKQDLKDEKTSGSIASWIEKVITALKEQKKIDKDKIDHEKDEAPKSCGCYPKKNKELKTESSHKPLEEIEKAIREKINQINSLLVAKGQLDWVEILTQIEFPRLKQLEKYAKRFHKDEETSKAFMKGIESVEPPFKEITKTTTNRKETAT